MIRCDACPRSALSLERFFEEFFFSGISFGQQRADTNYKSCGWQRTKVGNFQSLKITLKSFSMYVIVNEDYIIMISLYLGIDKYSYYIIILRL